jgi:aminoglycoside phosphotransferase (APT) family kinase protein
MSGQQMHADEVETDAELVRRLLAAQHPQWTDLPIEPVASAGTDNALYRLGDDVSVRLPRIEWASRQGPKEHEWLPRLAPLVPLPLPVPVALGVPGEGYPWPWTVCRWLEGENVCAADIADLSAFTAELAGFVVALHAVDATGGPPAGPDNFFRGCPLAWRDGPTRAAIDALERTFDTDDLTAAWEADVEAPVWTGAPTWVHGDLSPGNFLCTEGRLSGVIDFGGLGVGDPAGDLVVAWNLLPAAARDGFRTALPHLDDAAWRRGRGWALSIALIQLPYYRDTNPTLAAGSRHVIDEVLRDQP